MPAKKNKGKTVSLAEFQATGSWADDVPDPEPEHEVQPARHEKRNGAAAVSSDWRGSSSAAPAPPAAGRFGDDRRSAPLQWPDKPPFTAFVGNLDFSTTDADLMQFFDKTKQARVIKVRDRSKGYGYVEFETLEALKVAVGMNGVEYKGRALRLDVTDPPKDHKGGGLGGGFNALASDWRGSMGSAMSAAEEMRGEMRGGKGGGKGSMHDREHPGRGPPSRDLFGGAGDREAEREKERERERERREDRERRESRTERAVPAFSRDALGSELKEVKEKDEKEPKRDEAEEAGGFSRHDMGMRREDSSKLDREREREKPRKDKGLTYSTAQAPTRDIFGGNTGAPNGKGKGGYRRAPPRRGSGDKEDKEEGSWGAGGGSWRDEADVPVPEKLMSAKENKGDDREGTKDTEKEKAADDKEDADAAKTSAAEDEPKESESKPKEKKKKKVSKDGWTTVDKTAESKPVNTGPKEDKKPKKTGPANCFTLLGKKK